jgi:hypothetical protein
MKLIIGTLAGVAAGVAIYMLLDENRRSSITDVTRKQWRRIWGKPDLDEDPWAEYNERKASTAHS